MESAEVIDTLYASNMPILVETLSRHGIGIAVHHPRIKQEDIGARLAEASIVVVHKMPSAEYADSLGENCLAVMRAGAGYDILPLDRLTENGIAALNVPYGAKPVAQHTLGFILVLANHTIEQQSRMITSRDLELGDGKWLSSDRTIPNLDLGKYILGIIGLGKIGQRVYELTNPLFGDIVAYDPYLNDSVFDKPKLERAGSLTELLSNSDIVTLHVPLIKKRQEVFLGHDHNYMPTGQQYEPTVGLIGAEEIRKMKQGAFFINTSRGETVGYNALHEALLDGRIGGAALDVHGEEPLPLDSPWRKLGMMQLPHNNPLRRMQELYNVVLTPHTAGNLEGVPALIDQMATDEIMRVLNGEMPHFLVNPQILQQKNLRLKLKL